MQVLHNISFPVLVIQYLYLRVYILYSQISGVKILRRLETYPSLAENLKYTQVEQFLQLVRRLWPEIVPSQSSQPIILPTHIIVFLAAVL